MPEKFRVEWRRISLSDLILVVTVFGGLLGAWVSLHDWRRDVDNWKDLHSKALTQSEQKLDSNGLKLDKVLETQREIVTTLHEYPPHRHVGGQVVYPNELPHVYAEKSARPDPESDVAAGLPRQKKPEIK